MGLGLGRDGIGQEWSGIGLGLGWWGRDSITALLADAGFQQNKISFSIPEMLSTIILINQRDWNQNGTNLVGHSGNQTSNPIM